MVVAAMVAARTAEALMMRSVMAKMKIVGLHSLPPSILRGLVVWEIKLEEL